MGGADHHLNAQVHTQHPTLVAVLIRCFQMQTPQSHHCPSCDVGCMQDHVCLLGSDDAIVVALRECRVQSPARVAGYLGASLRLHREYAWPLLHPTKCHRNQAAGLWEALNAQWLSDVWAQWGVSERSQARPTAWV